ncbi:MAG: hypothetical protein H6659_00735 [Ardenticatenaceae bacterium]|nr:hypothetical protein [Anaerolineales bacterium]MCB8982330.1 hypothetical protein [Ardenticatenaceae bacterium]
MRKFTLSLFLAFLLGAATFSLIQVARGQGSAGGNPILSSETQGENQRQIQGAAGEEPQQPDIGFIDSPSATCYQPDAGRDACYINWYYLSVGASPNYMITMTLTLNDRGPVAHTQGFFQTSMYVPYSMLGDGFKVACGPLGAGGNPLLGNAYAYTIRARDSAGLASANYGTVYCPAYQP